MSDSNNGRTANYPTKRSIVRWLVILGGVLAAVLAVSTYLLKPIFPPQYIIYMQVAEVTVIGYFVIQILSKITYQLAILHSEPTANSIKSLIRIVGAIIVIAFMISFLSRDPIIAASISTISGLVIGFAASNLIGNAIAGLYLAITRPFKIEDTISVFGQTGKVTDIGLLYTRLKIKDADDEMLVSNSSIVSTWFILVKNTQDRGTDPGNTKIS